MAGVAHKTRFVDSRPRERLRQLLEERKVNQETAAVVGSSRTSSPCSASVRIHRLLPSVVVAPLGLKRQHIGFLQFSAVVFYEFTKVPFFEVLLAGSFVLIGFSFADVIDGLRSTLP